MDGLLGLVTMLPQEHVADPFPELWPQKPVLYLLRNDIIWKRNKQVRPMCAEKAQGFGVWILPWELNTSKGIWDMKVVLWLCH